MAQIRIPIDKLQKTVRDRLEKQIEKINARNPRIAEALTTVGFVLEEEMKRTIQRKRIIDSSNLINHTTFEFFETKNTIGIKVGTFGVPYAKYHEFGSKFTIRNLRAMFYYKRLAGEHKRKFVDKNVVVLSKSGIGYLKKRPYVAPSVSKKQSRVIQILKSIYFFK